MENKKMEKKKKIPGRRFVGVVVSASEVKTIRVVVKAVKTNSKYHKQITTSTKFGVHDEKGTAKVGDKVIIEECRPLSRTKRWRLIGTTTKA